MTWKFVNTGFNSGRFNMEFDYALAMQLRNGSGVQVLRVYGWQPAAISVGFNQQMEDFDTGKLRDEGIDLVRRPTGGRAILHSNELTYSVVMPIEHQSPREIYHFINQGLLCGLKHLNIAAELTAAHMNLRTLYQAPEGIPCFSSSAKSEIQYSGRKLVGSAQRRYSSVILQHGSILLGPQHRRIVEFLSHRHDDVREEVEERLTSGTIDIETILGRTVSFDDAARAFKEGFQEYCCTSFEEFALEELLVPTSIES